MLRKQLILAIMFDIYKDYYRDELLAFVGSKQRQSGIIWGDKEPGCVIITSGGRGGKSAGYGDEKKKDGSLLYIGQGAIGNQDERKYANSLLADGKRTVLFFSTREPNAAEVRERSGYHKLYRFEGYFEVASWDFYVPTSGKRLGNKLIRFLLVPAFTVFDNNYQSRLKDYGEDVGNLRIALNLKAGKPEKGQLNPSEYYKRNKKVSVYAIKRANGYCENCGQPAPFFDSNNLPFLEVHHITRLSDEGLDSPENVAAICPNCHRQAHFGFDKNELNAKLLAKIFEMERNIEHGR